MFKLIPFLRPLHYEAFFYSIQTLLSWFIKSLRWLLFFTDHSWIKEHVQQHEVPCGQCCEISFTLGDLGSCSFSTPLVSASRDVSFSTGSLVPCQTVADHSSPAFTCRSSFSSVIFDTPYPSTISFSFQSSCESDNLRFSSPIPVMSSFAFFTPEQQKPFSFTSDESKTDTSKTGIFFSSCSFCIVLS